MNPEGHPGEFVQMQQGRYDGPYGQPHQPTMVQYTTVNVTTDPPRDHIIWSICCFFHSNPFCLGLAALIFSIKARDRKMVGDMDGARHYGSTARCLNIISTVIVSILILIAIIVVSVTISQAQAAYRSYSYNYNSNYNNYRG